LIGIVKAHHRFGLGPPLLLVGVRAIGARGVRLVQQATIWLQGFGIDPIGHSHGFSSGSRLPIGIAQHVGCLHQKPASLYVVAVGDRFRQMAPAPTFIKVEPAMVRVRVYDVVEENREEVAQPGAQRRIIPRAQQVGVCFHEMQHRVHGFG